MEQVSGIATEILDLFLRSYDQLARLFLYLVREGVGVRSGQALSDFYALAGGNMRYVVGLGLSIWIGLKIWPDKSKASAKQAGTEKEKGE